MKGNFRRSVSPRLAISNNNAKYIGFDAKQNKKKVGKKKKEVKTHLPLYGQPFLSTVACRAAVCPQSIYYVRSFVFLCLITFQIANISFYAVCGCKYA